MSLLLELVRGLRVIEQGLDVLQGHVRGAFRRGMVPMGGLKKTAVVATADITSLPKSRAYGEFKWKLAGKRLAAVAHTASRDCSGMIKAIRRRMIKK